ncbi:MAG: hypothetical protein QOF99_1947, partial [Pseudonocardiales bacterium]|nr:hypothetical protein [Pseudonocardiales bacterium]
PHQTPVYRTNPAREPPRPRRPRAAATAATHHGSGSPRAGGPARRGARPARDRRCGERGAASDSLLRGPNTTRLGEGNLLSRPDEATPDRQPGRGCYVSFPRADLASPPLLRTSGITCELVVLGLHRPGRARALPGLPGEPGARGEPATRAERRGQREAAGRRRVPLPGRGVLGRARAHRRLAGRVPGARQQAAAVPAQRRRAAAPGTRRAAQDQPADRRLQRGVHRPRGAGRRRGRGRVPACSSWTPSAPCRTPTSGPRPPP